MRRFYRIIAGIFWLGIAAVPGWCQHWQWQNPLPQGNSLNDVQFVDAQHGWAVGDGGVIIHTSDGGASWNLQCSDTTDNLVSVCFVDTTEGWTISEHGAIRWTMDGGITWNAQYTGQFLATMRRILFTDECNGWIFGYSTYHTTDCGVTWNWARLPAQAMWGPIDIKFLNSQHGWTLGPDSIGCTTDGGQSWTTHQILPGANMSAMDFVDENHGWVIGADSSGRSRVLRTSDGGITWDTLPSQQYFPSGNSLHLDFYDLNHGWLLGGSYSSSSLMRTSDGGNTWMETGFGEGPQLSAFSIPDGQHGWIAGAGGILLQTSNGGAIWSRRDHTVTTVTLMDVAFADARRGCAIGGDPYYGDQTTFLRTTDGGSNWMTCDSFYGGYLASVCLRESGNGWAVGETGLIMHTTDYGASWHEQTSPFADGGLADVAFVDDQSGFAVGGRGTEELCFGVVLKTTNGGDTWTILRQDSNAAYSCISLLDAQRMWVSGDSGAVIRTTDGGQTWEHRDFAFADRCYYVQAVGFVDDLHGWACGSGFCGWDFETYISQQTTDGGISWEPWDYLFNNMVFPDRQHGWAAGESGVIHTTNGGLTWISDNAPVTWWGIHKVDFPDLEHGWAVGYYGTIMAYNTSNTSTPPVNPHPVAESYSLSAYPNPFNPTTTLVLHIPTASRVQVQVFDVLGRQVETAMDRVMAAGEYRLPFDGSRLSSGIYFARMKAGNFTGTQKLLLLR